MKSQLYNLIFLNFVWVITFINCTYHENNLAKCLSEQLYIQGEWQKDNLDKVDKVEEFETVTGCKFYDNWGVHLCYKRNNSEFVRGREIASWKWNSKCSSLEAFNDTVMAELLTNRNVLFVGDSITQEHFYELECMLWQQLDLNKTRVLRNTVRRNTYRSTTEVKAAKDAYALKSNSTIYYIRSDYFVHNSKYTIQLNESDEQDFNTLWATLSKEVDILILNIGCHLPPKWNLSLAIENVLQYLLHLRVHNPKLTIIYRTSLSGARDCYNYTSPSLPKSNNAYNWNLLDYYDNKWLHKVKEIWKGEWLWLNITHLSNYRSEARSDPPRDCLHFCIPGPIRTWNQILYNMLLNKIRVSKFLKR